MPTMKFEHFLQERFSSDHPQILDDDLAEKYEDWMCELDQDRLIAYADLYGSQVALDTVKEFGSKLNL